MITLNKIQMALLTVVIMVVIPFSTYAVDGQIKIGQTPSTTFPIVINKPGSYVLTSNLVVPAEMLNVNAIEITVNDVTLDLNGHMIQGPHTGPPWGGNGRGIYTAANRYTITIKNGKIWGFGNSGIYFYATPSDPDFAGAGHLIDNMQVMNNGARGIAISGGLVSNCIVSNNGDELNGTGIAAFDSTITNCTANKNGVYGIKASYSLVTHCTASENGYGIGAWGGSSVTNCIANKNRIHGFDANSTSLMNCTAIVNGNNGFEIDSVTMTNCISHSNLGNGIYTNNDSRIDGNNIRWNHGYGIYIQGQQGNYVIKNTLSGNFSGPFRVPSISDNYIPDCDLVTTDNCNYRW